MGAKIGLDCPESNSSIKNGRDRYYYCPIENLEFRSSKQVKTRISQWNDIPTNNIKIAINFRSEAKRFLSIRSKIVIMNWPEKKKTKNSNNATYNNSQGSESLNHFQPSLYCAQLIRSKRFQFF